MTEIRAENNKNMTPRYRRVFVWTLFLSLVILGGIFFLRWAKQKSIGTVSVLRQGASVATVGEQSKKKYEGKYFTFSYPGQYEAPHDQLDVKFPILERKLLKEPGFEGKKIAVGVQDNAGNTLDDFSSYRIRSEDPAMYTPKDAVVQGHRATFFTKNTPVYEAGVFLAFDQKVVSIIITSQTKMGDMRGELEAILESFQFSQ